MARGGALRGFGRRLGGNATRVVRLLGARNALGSRDAQPSLWLLARIGPHISEQRPSFSLGRERSLALLDLLRALDAARVDRRVQGVIVRIEGTPLGWSQAAALRDVGVDKVYVSNLDLRGVDRLYEEIAAAADV